MNNDLESLRRDVRYAALPGKVGVGFLVVIACLFIGMFGFGVAVYLFGLIARSFFGGF
jgi:hypothetical protein